MASCLYTIPCFFTCAPTENPDKSFFRRWSNEYSLPGADCVVKCQGCCETNAFCRACGKGAACGDKNRKPLMSACACLNLIGLILGIIATCGMSSSVGTLRKFHWVKGNVKMQTLSGRHIQAGIEMDLYIGTSAQLYEVDCNKAGNLQECIDSFANNPSWKRDGNKFDVLAKWSDSDLCKSTMGYHGHGTSTLSNTGSNAQNHAQLVALQKDNQKTKDACKKCKKALISNISLIFAVINQIFMILQDLQRTTLYGDVNCQACMGVGLNIQGAICKLLALTTFMKACYDEMPTELSDAKIDWSLGFAWYCLLIAILIKIPDAVGHCVVPTAPEKRQPGDRFENIVEYMMRGSQEKSSAPPQQIGMPEEKAESAEI